MTTLKQHVIQDIINERSRQDDKWGLQRHPLPLWMVILVEEVGELAQAMQRINDWGKESDADDPYTEAIHVAAVATAIAEQLKEAMDKMKIYANDEFNREL